MDTVTKSDELVMQLLHYFITQKGYNPIVLHGAKDEIWLENLNSDYKIVRIVSNYIHNNEQFDVDLFKTKKIVNKIKKTTFSFNINALSIFINLNDNVILKKSYGNIDIVKLTNFEDIKKYKNIIEFFPDITKNSDFKEKGLELFLKLTGEITKKNEEEGIKAEEIFKPKKPIITVFLIMANVLLFILMYVIGDGSNNAITLIKFGAFQKDLILDGQYYRLLTSSFLHIGIFHLLFNCYALYIIGRQLESFIGKIKFLLVYLVSALLGNLLSMLFPINISAGASGAIFGLLGSMLYFGYNYRVYLGTVLKSQIIPLIIINLLFGFFASGVNNAAHIGGLIGGILITMALGIKYKSKKTQQINGFVLLSIFILFLIYVGFFM